MGWEREPAILCEKVQGSSHKRRGSPCQDAYCQDVDAERAILAVADGHGSDACRYSAVGAEIAAEVFCSLLADLWRGRQDRDLLADLGREGEVLVAQRVEREWKRRVEEDYRQRQEEDPETEPAMVHKLYGTTLLGLLAAEGACFAFQLGDGEISYVDSGGCREVVSGEKLLGVETYSLSQKDAWQYAVAGLRRLEGTGPFAFLLSTDGFFYSHVNEQEYQKSCLAYFELLREEGPEPVRAHLAAWLDETSELGCGDDITLMIAYFDGKSEEEDG